MRRKLGFLLLCMAFLSPVFAWQKLDKSYASQTETPRQPVIDVHLHSESLEELQSWGPNPVTGKKAPASVEEHIRLQCVRRLRRET
jgi:hypothetical protein